MAGFWIFDHAMRTEDAVTQLADWVPAGRLACREEIPEMDAFNQENRVARIAGGMHFQFSAVAGEQIGQQVADWIAARHFQRQ